MRGTKGGCGRPKTLPFPTRNQRRKTEGRTLRTLSSSAAPALPTRDADSTFGSNIGAELSKVVLVPDALPRSPETQHITDNRCATCRRSNEAAFSTLQLQTGTQLLPGASRLRRFKCFPWLVCGAPGHTRSTSLTFHGRRCVLGPMADGKIHSMWP